MGWGIFSCAFSSFHRYQNRIDFTFLYDRARCIFAGVAVIAWPMAEHHGYSHMDGYLRSGCIPELLEAAREWR